ncbi:hypothetical protein O181_068690 [Austropuccinia psidii MF-1]|uniref:Uncharacterized protein n=1 Tax=Austropuccinia psidii MF-1 TaxID=1389203 RepID=A0A9Q3ET12_9BASI|nr:hypothetical protein [Austropuccinia psidii MF-1]
MCRSCLVVIYKPLSGCFKVPFPRLSSLEEVYPLLNLLKSEVLSLKSACSSDAAEVQSLRMQLLSSPPPGSSFQPLLCISTSAYDRFMQEPYHAADCFGELEGDGSNFPEWVEFLNRIHWGFSLSPLQTIATRE